jgi:hypothetical protein
MQQGGVMIKTEGIPIWVTIFALIVWVLHIMMAVGGIFAPDDNEDMEGMQNVMRTKFTGLLIAIAVVAGVTVFMRNIMGYVILFSALIATEVSNLAAELARETVHTPAVTIGIIFLILTLFSWWVSARAASKCSKEGS